MEKKVAKELIEAALGSIKKNLESALRDEEKPVRYDFEWSKVEGDLRAIVTRHEWDPGCSITNLPLRSSKFMVEVAENSIRMLPVPPAKTFQIIPESERVFFESVVRAYFAGSRGEVDHTCWERIPTS